MLYVICDTVDQYCITMKIHFHASCMLNAVKKATFRVLSQSENFKWIEFVQMYPAVYDAFPVNRKRIFMFQLR